MTSNPWFRRKSFGWGWSPASWQGWLVTLGGALALAALATWLQLHLIHTSR
jgi:hypothetical protein